ncbi:MAG: Hint domain-containing protein [Rhodopila sp.]
MVNHRSIRWDDHAQEVEIYHIELQSHDILVANGAPTESYRDDGNRWLFQNGNERWQDAPDPPCVPVVTGGAIVDAVWSRLLARAGGRPGLPLTADPALHLLVDGRRIDPVQYDGRTATFHLTTGCGAVRVVSRAAAPAELGLGRDPRQLGVPVRRVVLFAG